MYKETAKPWSVAQAGKYGFCNSIVRILILSVPLNIYVNLGQFPNGSVNFFIWIVVIPYLVYRVFAALMNDTCNASKAVSCMSLNLNTHSRGTCVCYIGGFCKHTEFLRHSCAWDREVTCFLLHFDYNDFPVAQTL